MLCLFLMYKELNQEGIERVLRAEKFGNLGCSIHNKPYVFPMAFVYHDNVIYGQTTTGHKTKIIRENPNVCFQTHMLTDSGWASVMCWGIFQELDFEDVDDAQSTQVVKMLIEKLSSVQHPIGVKIQYSQTESLKPLSINGHKSTLFRIVITEKTGKFFDE